MAELLHDLLFATAAARPDGTAVIDREAAISYETLTATVDCVAGGLLSLGVGRGERVATLLPKRFEKVAALFGALRAGAVAVPMNPLLRAPQIRHILGDCEVSVLVTTAARLAELAAEPFCTAGLKAIVVVDPFTDDQRFTADLVPWPQLISAGARSPHGINDSATAALFYTSGSTGKPKGVILSHRNMVAGAHSVAGYLGNTPDDRLLAMLSFSFDYGFSQMSTAFLVGARVVLMEYLLPQEVLRIVEREVVTGLAGVPPMWIQLAALRWPDTVAKHVRYITNSGGRMPAVTLAKLRAALPATKVFLMYGLTEAFRSTYLAPEELDRRPDSIGKAIPDVQILVLREDGSPCGPDEPGELVHCGPLVAQGYWNHPKRTAVRFRPLPQSVQGHPEGEVVVWSGDIVRTDAEGFLYFISRRDEMIKTSGYRVSPTEVEEEVHASGLVADVVALGVPHERLGQGIVVVVSPASGHEADTGKLLDFLRPRLPRYMVPLRVDWREALPRTPNGKLDRSLLHRELNDAFAGEKA